MADSSEFIENRTVANANPTSVGAHVRNWDATQVSADSTADQDIGVVVWKETDGGLLVWQLGRVNCISLCLLFFGEPSDEDWSSVPNHLENFTYSKSMIQKDWSQPPSRWLRWNNSKKHTWRKISNVELCVRVSIITSPS